jgi:hypothetical protein
MPASSGLAFVTILGILALGDGKGPQGRGEPVQATLAFDDSQAAKTVNVDNVFGSVEVVGGVFEDVRVSGLRTVRADTPEAAERARREVSLDMSESGNVVDIAVNGPFRSKDGSLHWDWDDRRYVVRYDLKVQVPESAALSVKTVNEGQVVVRNVNGRLLVRNVNGAIELDRVGGAVDARTVNGGIRAQFRESPSAACDFKTVNGDVRLGFGADLSADFALKTLSGQLLSAFEVQSLPARPVEGHRENGKYVYRSDRFQNIRVGKGGPRVSMETLNGDLIIGSR